MASTVFQFLDLAGVTELKDQLITYVDSKDAASIKGVGISGNKLSFYKEEPISGATAAYEVELPEADLSAVMQLVSNVTADAIATFDSNGQVKDSGKKLADFYLKTDVDTLIAALEAKVDANTEAIANLDTAVDTRIASAKTDLESQIATAKDSLQANIDKVDEKTDTNADAIGNLEDLGTTSKGDLVAAINEVKASVSAGGEAGLVTIEESSSDEYAKIYTFKQGGAKIGSVNLPKDMVVQSGEVVVNPDGQVEGTYLKLVLANSDNTELFINVGTLVDIYKAEANASQIQLTIDSTTREISAHVVAGSIGSDEIADAAIVTVKIADGNVTLAKLSTAVQASLAKADNAASQADLDAEIERAGQAEADLSERLDKIEEDLGDGGSVADQIADAVAESKTFTNEEIAKVNAVLGTVDSGKTVVQMIEESEYDDSEVQSSIASNQLAITNLDSKHTTDKQALDAKDAEHEEAIAANAEDIAELQEAVDNIQAIPVATITALFNS